MPAELRGVHRDVKDLIAEFVPLGWEPSRTNKGHIKMVHPGGAMHYLPSTPSDWRGIRNSRAELRRKTDALNIDSIHAVEESTVEQSAGQLSHEPVVEDEAARLDALVRASQEEAAERADEQQAEQQALAVGEVTPTQSLPRPGSIQRRVYEALRSSLVPLNPTELGEKLDVTRYQAYQALYQMSRMYPGVVEQLGDGTWDLTENIEREEPPAPAIAKQEPKPEPKPERKLKVVRKPAPEPEPEPMPEPKAEVAPSAPPLAAMMSAPPPKLEDQQQVVYETIMVGADGRRLLKADDGTFWLAQRLEG